MIVYRIVHKDYSKHLYASGMPGRWNSNGKKVIYCAESIALAFLENMIRRQGAGFQDNFRTMFIDISDSLKIDKVDVKNLPADWRSKKDYSKCQPLGDAWYDTFKTAVLQVPSAVLPESYNFVLNTLHPEYSKIKLITTTELIPDERIDDILKRSK